MLTLNLRRIVFALILWLFWISPGIPHIWDGIIDGKKEGIPDAKPTRTQVKRYTLAAIGYS